MIYHVISRANEANLVNDVIVLSPDMLPDLPEGTKEFVLFNHDEKDVLTRYAKCLELNPCDYVVRLTADCPMLDPRLIDFVVDTAVHFNADYCSNVIEPTFPDGVDVEVIKAPVLKILSETVSDPRLREHVTLALREAGQYQKGLNLVSIVNDSDFSSQKISVDTEEDLKRVRDMGAY